MCECYDGLFPSSADSTGAWGEQYLQNKHNLKEKSQPRIPFATGFPITRTFQDCLVRKEREFALQMQRLREQLSQVGVCDETIL